MRNLVGCGVVVLLAVWSGSCASLTIAEVGTLAEDFIRHDSFHYVNADALSESWFMAAYRTVDDPAVYIVLSDTGSPASRIISLFTKSQYNHVSIAFDDELKTLVSYNGGNGIHNPGLNPENIKVLNQKSNASIAVYRLEASATQKIAIIEEVARINREGSSYHLLGLITKQSYQPNIMFCSQFVYAILGDAGLDYFEMDGLRVKPMDFIAKNNAGTAVFMYETQLNEVEVPYSEVSVAF
jgi:hypothetical protein